MRLASFEWVFPRDFIVYLLFSLSLFIIHASIFVEIISKTSSYNHTSFFIFSLKKYYILKMLWLIRRKKNNFFKKKKLNKKKKRMESFSRKNDTRMKIPDQKKKKKLWNNPRFCMETISESIAHNLKYSHQSHTSLSYLFLFYFWFFSFGWRDSVIASHASQTRQKSYPVIFLVFGNIWNIFLLPR